MIGNTIRASVQTRAGRAILRASCAAAVALVVGGASSSPARPAAQTGECRVEFTGISDVAYNPALQLSGVIIKGSHNYAPATLSGGSGATPFEVLDHDGFLTLFILLNEWRASGQLDRNATEAVDFRRGDLALALEAVERGLRYHEAVATTITDDTPNREDARRLLALKADGMRAIAEGLRPAMSGDQGLVELPAGFLSARMGLFLDRLTPPEQIMQAQYLDRPTGGAPNILCDRSAASAFIGHLLCGYQFASGQAREPAVCPQGIRLTRLAALPRCRRVGGQDVC